MNPIQCRLTRMLGVGLLAVCAAPASAEITGGQVTGGTSGGAFLIADPVPAAIGPDSLQSPDLVAFNERQDLVLVAPVMIAPGVIAGTGSELSSHYVAFDPAMPSTLVGFVDFGEPIVALVLGPQLGPTTQLFGLRGTDYTAGPGLGPDLAGSDTVLIDPSNSNRLLVNLGANSPGDHVRVLTGTLVPEPATWSLGLVMLALASLAPRRSPTRSVPLDEQAAATVATHEASPRPARVSS